MATFYEIRDTVVSMIDSMERGIIRKSKDPSMSAEVQRLNTLLTFLKGTFLPCKTLEEQQVARAAYKELRMSLH
jgi:hypothetical protein